MFYEQDCSYSEKLNSFLLQNDLLYDQLIEHTVCLTDETGNIAATGSISSNVLKCIAVDPKYRGEGLLPKIVTSLTNYAFSKGRKHLFVFTKPKNLQMFSDIGFYKIVSTDDILLMENKKDGIQNYLQNLTGKENKENVGAIVANCNPFTEGHRFLIETALKQCNCVHLFILSENRSYFSAEERMKMVKEGTKNLKNLYIHSTEEYLISSATFPTYFIKDQAKAQDANCELDIKLFGTIIAPYLNITKRFAGTEPLDPVTNAYNEKMKQMLPEYGIQLIEIPRLKDKDGNVISASLIRKRL